MFTISAHDLRNHTNAQTADFLKTNFAEDDEVWQGASGALAIGDGIFAEDEDEEFSYISSVAEYVESLRALVAAR